MIYFTRYTRMSWMVLDMDAMHGCMTLGMDAMDGYIALDMDAMEGCMDG